jgi:phage/plasmid-associated DNA primase
LEQTFGYNAMLDKQVIMANDLVENQAQTFKADVFKAMADGGSCNVPKKHIKSITISKWRQPFMFISRHWPNYQDKEGAISKRFIFFECNRLIPSDMKDASLESKIVQNQLPSILYKAVKARKEYLEQFQDKVFEDVRPEYFKNAMNTYQIMTNIVFKFVTQESNISINTNGRRIEYSIQYGNPDLWSEWSEFTYKFNKRPELTKQKYELKQDESTFRPMGSEVVKRVNLCKLCRKIYKNRGVEKCCSATYSNQRHERTIIKEFNF